MKPFSIHCPTCRSRLKVRDAAVIGQILACPKCQSMVLIERPAEAADENSTKSAKPQQQAHHSSSGSGIIAAPAPVSATFDDAASLLSDQPSPPPQSFTAAAPDEGTPPESATADNEVSTAGANEGGSPVLPTDQWTSPTAQRWQQMLLIGGGSIAGLTLAVGLFGFVMYRATRSSPPVAAATGPEREQDDASVAADGNADGGAPAPVAPPDEIPPTKNDGGEAADSSDTSPPAGDNPAKPAVDKASLSSKPPENPFDVDVPSRDPSDGTEKPAPKPAAVADAKDDKFEEFAPFLDDVTLPLEAFKPAAKDDRPKKPEGASDLRMDETPLPRPEPVAVDVGTQLKTKIVRLEFAGMPLIDFARFITDLTTIPISLDPKGLQVAKVTPAAAVTVNASDATVSAILTDALAPLGLAYVRGEGHLRITNTKPADLRTIKLPISDLAGDAEAAEELVETIVELVASGSWEDDDGKATLRVEDTMLVVTQSDAVLLDVLVFLEKLRVARSGTPQNGSFPRSYFNLDTRSSRAAESLERRLSVNYGQPTRLVEMVTRLESETETRILIDWQAAGEVGWNPNGVSTLSVADKSLSDSLTSLLRPMDLAYRIVDGNTLQITTPKRLNSAVELEFYPARDLLAPGDDGAALLERIRMSLGQHRFRDGGGDAAVHFDATAACVVAAMSQPMQITLEKQLDEWRAAK